jgi:hypothetical protein
MGASRGMYGLLMAKPTRGTERGPSEMCCSEPDEADLTWAGLPYHIWKGGKKISSPSSPLYLQAQERQILTDDRSMVQYRGRVLEENPEEDDSRPGRDLAFDRWRTAREKRKRWAAPKGWTAEALERVVKEVI